MKKKVLLISNILNRNQLPITPYITMIITKKQTRLTPLLSLFVLVISLSCSVQKRNYRPGYYISWNNGQNKLKKVSSQNNPDKPQTASARIHSHNENTKNIRSLTANADENAQPFITESKTLFSKPILTNPDSLCDIILMNNGDEVKARVKEIGTDEIRYVKCENSDGPVYVVRKSSVFMLKYANGTKEVIKSDSNNNNSYNSEAQQKKKKSSDRRTDGNAIVSIVSAALSLFSPFIWLALSLAISGFVAGVRALMAINKNPDTKKGRGWAIAGMIISALVIIVLIAALALI